MAFPMMLVLAVAVVYVTPSIWTLFAVMVAIKGLSYALNNPSKEMLYMVRLIHLHRWVNPGYTHTYVYVYI